MSCAFFILLLFYNKKLIFNRLCIYLEEEGKKITEKLIRKYTVHFNLLMILRSNKRITGCGSNTTLIVLVSTHPDISIITP